MTYLAVHSSLFSAFMHISRLQPRVSDLFSLEYIVPVAKNMDHEMPPGPRHYLLSFPQILEKSGGRTRQDDLKSRNGRATSMNNQS